MRVWLVMGEPVYRIVGASSEGFPYRAPRYSVDNDGLFVTAPDELGAYQEWVKWKEGVDKDKEKY